MADAHELLRQLQVALSLRVRTGKITLNVKDGRLESIETYVYARLREKPLDEVKSLSP